MSTDGSANSVNVLFPYLNIWNLGLYCNCRGLRFVVGKEKVDSILFHREDYLHNLMCPEGKNKNKGNFNCVKTKKPS